MSTGKAYVNITNKSILGFSDIGARFLSYLKEKADETTQYQWDVDGAFNTAYGLAGPGNDLVGLTGTNFSTDGIGHLLNPAAAAANDLAVQFENESGITYEVGLKYAEAPSVVRINPKEGLPEYSRFTEIIGESASPTSVVDNGGTITFNVNSVTEAGVDNTGRRVLVFKKSPANGALNDSIAIEERVVAYAAGNNTITTADTLGQSTVSTTASDYTVILLGLSVKRNLSIESASGYMFVGTVTGVGAGGTPVAFNVLNQRIIKTFQDASQLTFNPYLWLTATTVQSALQQVVDILASSGGANSGATRVGFNANDTSLKVPPTSEHETVDWGGIGDIADATFDSNSDLMDAVDQIDQTIKSQRAIKTGHSGASPALFSGANAPDLAQTSDGIWVLRAQNAGAGEAPGTPSTISVEQLRFPYVTAEHAGRGRPEDFHVINATGGPEIRGKYDRVRFETTDDVNIEIEDGFQAENFSMRSGNVQVNQQHFSPGVHPISHLKNGMITPSGAALSRPALDFEALDTGSRDQNHCVFENMYIEAESGQDCLRLPNDWRPDNIAEPRGQVVFRNCVFYAPGGGKVVDGSAGCLTDVRFENCRFISDSAQADWCVDISVFSFSNMPVHVNFQGCHFVAPQGQAIRANGNGFNGIHFSDCKVVAGEVIAGDTGLFGVIDMTNCIVSGLNVTCHDRVMRSISVSDYLVKMDDCIVTNLDINQIETSVNSNASGILWMHGDQGAANGIHINVNGGYDLNGASPGIVQVRFGELSGTTESGIYSNINLDWQELPGDGADLSVWVKVFRCTVNNIHFNTPTFGANWDCALQLDFGARVSGVYFNNGNLALTNSNFNRLIDVIEGRGFLKDVSMSNSWTKSAGTGLGFMRVNAPNGDWICENLRAVVVENSSSDTSPIDVSGGGDDIQFSNCMIEVSGTQDVNNPAIYVQAAVAHFRFVNNTLSWPGQAFGIHLDGSDNGLVTANIIDRGAGAAAYVQDDGTANLTTGNNLVA